MALWLRSADTTVRVYQDQAMVAIHPRLVRPGQRATVAEHLPPNQELMRDLATCRFVEERVSLLIAGP